eukprot:CAMPEP_0197651552 /NCGR_PEP_ID=MMETSP1338-20131121/33062_1 /TAXON_ID=43686 ORGANISM="Pelagodinium beii, Strain RCC1491" /NCGR_SAMPLE_ID=MMETSP1338 /ASSEMBLY_ACC=CAM_ASM_000754 /LENGTH=359 /DNA_ID=CAMNT_0043226219 /DNA_START=91 /DNA_END=1170 /DNA_ORIENTATION=-
MTATDAEMAKNSNRNTQFSKTKLCRFNLLGICAKGTQCPFAHGSVELQPLPDLRCTKLCKQLLSTGACTTAGCTYAHSKEELRAANRTHHAGKADSKTQKKNGKGAGKSAEKNVPQIPGVQRQSKGQKVEQADPVPPPGLEDYGGDGEISVAAAYRVLAMQQQQMQQQSSLQARDLQLYTKALTALISLADAPSTFSTPGQLSSDAPAYVPLNLDVDEPEGPLSEDHSEASALAEEVAATALLDDLDLAGEGKSPLLSEDLEKEYYYDEMTSRLTMNSAWGWNGWGGQGGWSASDYSASGYSAPGLPDGNVNIDQALWSYGAITATQADKFSKMHMKSVRTSSSTLCTLGASSSGDEKA